MKCPDCNSVLGITTKDEGTFFHIYEMCAYCGYIKAFVDYKDNDTGSIVWSGLDYWQSIVFMRECIYDV